MRELALEGTTLPTDIPTVTIEPVGGGAGAAPPAANRGGGAGALPPPGVLETEKCQKLMKAFKTYISKIQWKELLASVDRPSSLASSWPLD